MLKHVRAWALALASLALAPAVHAACPSPALTGLTGKDASSITQTLMTVIPPSQTQQVPVHITDVWNGTTYAPMISDANCNTLIGAPDGALVTLGTESDAAWTSGNGTVVALLKGMIAAAQAPIPAGNASIGKVQIDQQTPGTSNAVQATNFPAAISTGAGATGASSPRYTVAQDTTTISGSAPGTAGTPSANVVTVQGAAGMTAITSKQQDSGGNDATDTVHHSVNVTAPLSFTTTNPTSTLSLPATTTAYAANQLVATSATAGSVVVPSFNIANTAGGASIPRVRLSTNDATSTAWGGVQVQVDLWSAAPTFSNGDRGAFFPATGTANHLGTYLCTISAEYGDGAYAECGVSPGGVLVKLASGTAVFWTLQTLSASGVTGASKTFTLTAELGN